MIKAKGHDRCPTNLPWAARPGAFGRHHVIASHVDCLVRHDRCPLLVWTVDIWSPRPWRGSRVRARHRAQGRATAFNPSSRRPVGLNHSAALAHRLPITGFDLSLSFSSRFAVWNFGLKIIKSIFVINLLVSFTRVYIMHK